MGPISTRRRHLISRKSIASTSSNAMERWIPRYRPTSYHEQCRSIQLANPQESPQSRCCRLPRLHVCLPSECYHSSVRNHLRRSRYEPATRIVPDVPANRYSWWGTTVLASTFHTIWPTTNLHHQSDRQSCFQHRLCKESDLWDNGSLSSVAVIFYFSTQRHWQRSRCRGVLQARAGSIHGCVDSHGDDWHTSGASDLRLRNRLRWLSMDLLDPGNHKRSVTHPIWDLSGFPTCSRLFA